MIKPRSGRYDNARLLLEGSDHRLRSQSAAARLGDLFEVACRFVQRVQFEADRCRALVDNAQVFERACRVATRSSASRGWSSAD